MATSPTLSFCRHIIGTPGSRQRAASADVALTRAGRAGANRLRTPNGAAHAFQCPDARRAERPAPLHQPDEVPRDAGRWSSNAARACASMTSSGKDYIEAMAGLWCTALGWGENELAESAAEQMRKLAFGHLFARHEATNPAIALAEKLKEISPFPGRQGVLRQFRLGSERHAGQALLVRRQRARPDRRRRKSSRASRPITA